MIPRGTPERCDCNFCVVSFIPFSFSLFAFVSGGGGTTCFFVLLACHIIYHTTAWGQGAGWVFHAKGNHGNCANIFVSTEHHHTSAGSEGGSRLALASFAFSWRKRWGGIFATEFAILGLALSLCSLGLGLCIAGVVGLRQASSHRLPQVSPCTLTWAPGFAPSGLRWHRWSK